MTQKHITDIKLRQTQQLLFLAYRDFTNDADVLLTHYGFGRAHHRVIHFVGTNPGITVGKLLAILKITKQSLARVLSQLVQKKFIYQKKGKKDRRQKLLFLTSKGWNLMNKLSAIQNRRLATAFKASGKEAVKGFCTVLEQMIDVKDRHWSLK